MIQFMPDLTPPERLRLLQENAAKVEETMYQKHLTNDELADRRESLADNCIKFNQLEDELKEIKDTFKGQMDPLKMLNKKLLTEIKTKQQTIDGLLYHIPDFEKGIMETYDSEGYFISSRRLRPEEKQGNVFSLNKVNSL